MKLTAAGRCGAAVGQVAGLLDWGGGCGGGRGYLVYCDYLKSQLKLVKVLTCIQHVFCDVTVELEATLLVVEALTMQLHCSAEAVCGIAVAMQCTACSQYKTEAATKTNYVTISFSTVLSQFEYYYTGIAACNHSLGRTLVVMWARDAPMSQRMRANSRSPRRYLQRMAHVQLVSAQCT